MVGRHTRGRLATMLTAGVSACALAACGGSGNPQKSATQPSTPPKTAISSTSAAAPATSSTSTSAAAPTGPTPPRLTQAGSTVKLGQTAVVNFGTTLKNGQDGPSYTFAITIESITPGSLSDLRGISLTGVPKGDTPTYVKLRIGNVGKRPLKTSLGDPADSIGAIEGNDVDGDLTLIGSFPRCPQVDTPSPFAAGQSFSTCATIRETFTLLPCPGAPTRGSTLGQEGCVEHQIVKRDRQVDALDRTIFTKLGDDAARRRFTSGHAAWLVYRHAYCLSRSDTAEGGTLAGSSTRYARPRSAHSTSPACTTSSTTSAGTERRSEWVYRS